jgi:hypothetical protein
VSARRFAEGTSVPVSRSQDELRSLAKKAGAVSVVIGEEESRAVFFFIANNRKVRFTVPVPSPDEFQGRRSAVNAAEERRRWRALVLVVRAKLESVASGIEAFEDAFLAQIVVPGTSETVGEAMREQLETAYLTGKPVRLLLGAGSGA